MGENDGIATRQAEKGNAEDAEDDISLETSKSNFVWFLGNPLTVLLAGAWSAVEEGDDMSDSRRVAGNTPPAAPAGMTGR